MLTLFRPFLLPFFSYPLFFFFSLFFPSLPFPSLPFSFVPFSSFPLSIFLFPFCLLSCLRSRVPWIQLAVCWLTVVCCYLTMRCWQVWGLGWWSSRPSSVSTITLSSPGRFTTSFCRFLGSCLGRHAVTTGTLTSVIPAVVTPVEDRLITESQLLMV